MFFSYLKFKYHEFVTVTMDWALPFFLSHCSECIQKFGPDLGEEVWAAVNSVFDVLPIAAIVDDKVTVTVNFR